MENTLRNFASSGVQVKRFTYLRNGQLIQSKPKNTEKFVIVEDYLGDRSLLWVACIENSVELWRHNVNDIVRLTYENNA
jgi:predicted secreted protein